MEDYLGSLLTVAPRSPEFAAKASDVRSMGDLDIRRAAESSNRLLSSPIRAMKEGGLSEGSKVGSTLLELRRTVEDLDPAEASRTRKLLGLIPFGEKVDDYFRKYQSAQSHLDAILHALRDGQDELGKDNAALNLEKQQLWEAMGRLNQYVYIAERLDASLAAHVADLELSDPERAKALRDDVLFYVRQKHQDLLTQLAVSIQNYLAIDIVIKNNIELIKGVDRASTTTISALRTAVIVAQALGNQKLVLDQITALNTTTSAMIERTSEMLRDNSVAIQQQAASSTIGLPQLQAAFANIYATMDAIDTFKVAGAGQHGRHDRHAGDRGQQVPRLPRAGLAAGPARWPPVPWTSACLPEPGARAPHAGDTGTWRLHGRRPASSSDSSGDAPSRSARRWSCPASRRPRTCWRRWPGSSRWSPEAPCRPWSPPGSTRVCRTVRDTIPRLSTLGSGSPQAYSVMATATDYLPEAVGGYLRLPREFADSRPVDRGRTSLMVLIDQLDLLGATMDQVYDAVCRADAAALVAHGRFLAEKFGHAAGGGDLALSPDTVIAPDPSASAPCASDAATPDPGTATGTAALRLPAGCSHRARPRVPREGRHPAGDRARRRPAGAGVRRRRGRGRPPPPPGPRVPPWPRRWPSRRPGPPATGPPRPAVAAPATSSTPRSGAGAGAPPPPRR